MSGCKYFPRWNNIIDVLCSDKEITEEPPTSAKFKEIMYRVVNWNEVRISVIITQQRRAAATYIDTSLLFDIQLWFIIGIKSNRCQIIVPTIHRLIVVKLGWSNGWIPNPGLNKYFVTNFNTWKLLINTNTHFKNWSMVFAF